MNAKYDSGRVCNKREKRLAMEIIKPISIFRKCVDICGHIIIRCINMRIHCNKGEIIQADMMTRPQSKGLIWYVQFGIWLKGFTSLHFFSIFVQMVRVLLFFCCFANFSWQTFIFCFGLFSLYIHGMLMLTPTNAFLSMDCGRATHTHKMSVMWKVSSMGSI